jgi:hypothetical protein
MYKLITFAGYDNQTGPHIFPIEPDIDRTIGHIKMARPLPPAIEQYIRTSKPIPGKTQLLIDAMGAGEYYGSNVNGDYFPETALEHKGADYGHETFTHYAYPYKHHVNKDPARAYGERVTLAAYDRHMHRVLLIVIVDDSKCMDILGDLARGHYWDVSMGCKVPWDECSICKNRAKNRAQYCPHLRYQMNKILQDGRRVFAYNWLPKFFDISFVTIGAEKASHVLKKVAMNQGATVKSSAELGELYYAKLSAAEKSAVQKKRAEIEKDVPSQPPANVQGATPEDKQKLQSFVSNAGKAKSLEPSIPNSTLDTVAQSPLKDVFSTLGILGIDLKPEEFQRLILVKQGARALADELERRRVVFDEYHPGNTPSWAHEFARFDPGAVNEKVALALRPYLPHRSCYPEILLERLQRMEKQGAPYNRDSQWYPMTEEGKRRSSGIHGMVPAALALAAGFVVFKRMFPGLMMRGPEPVRAMSKHPWLLPLLVGAGVGATVGLQGMKGPKQLKGHGLSTGLDGKLASAYHDAETASTHVGDISLAYVQSGTQPQWRRIEQDAWFNKVASMRPELFAKHSFAGPGSYLGPSIVQVVNRLAAAQETFHGHTR